MSHSQKEKDNALELLKTNTIYQVYAVTGISSRTLYRWSKETPDVEAKPVATRDVIDDKDTVVIAADGSVTLSLSEGDRTFTRDEIDNLFLHYSNKGHDWSQRQIINEFKFLAPDWGRVKTKLGLFKVSNVFSDFTFNNIPASKRLDAVEDRLSIVHDNPNKIIDRAYTKSLQKQHKKLIGEQVRKDEVQKAFFAELAESFAVAGPVRVLQPIVQNARGPKDLMVAVSDIHINSRVRGLQDAQDYDNEICKGYLAEVARAANAKNAKNVTVLLNGDLLESITGKNHPDVFTEMELQSTYGDGIMKAVHILAGFLGQVNNLANVVVISGNHDRLTTSNREDAKGSAAQIIFEFLKLMLPSSEITWDPKILKWETEHICFIASHGDKLRNVKTEEIFYRYGSHAKFNFYLTGHWHNRAIKADNRFGRHLSLPSIFTGNTYSDHAGWTSDPGFIMIYCENGKPVVEDRSL